MSLTPREIRELDKSLKPDQYAEDAERLLALYENRAREIVRNHLRSLGLGNPQNRDPAMSGVVARLVRGLAVLYAQPPTRLLRRGTEILSHVSDQALALAKVADRMQLDVVWAEIDAMRLLLRTCIVSWAESKEHGTIVARLFPGHRVFRAPEAAAQDLLERDEAIALLLLEHSEPSRRLYQLWNREPEGWRVQVTDEQGGPQGPQPYPDRDGIIPFDELPLQLITDAPLMGQAYLPIPQNRLTSALAVDAGLNDLLHIVALEAHSQKAVTAEDTAQAASAVEKSGPDRVWVLPAGADARVLAHSPRIAEANQVVDRVLSLLALAESLPPDSFTATQQALTGAALRSKERDLDRRRGALAPLARHQERQAYQKIAAILDVYGSTLGLPRLDRSAELVTVYQNAWILDAQQQQAVGTRDLAIGAMSLPEYVAAQRGCSVDEARVLLEAVRLDAATNPVRTDVAGLAPDGGPNLALGEGSASINPANVAGSVEGSSVVAAAQKALGQRAPATATSLDAAPVEKVADTALNGAQILAATAIVEKVAQGALPRDAGINMLVEFFQLSPESAERIMGSVGHGFRPATSTPN